MKLGDVAAELGVVVAIHGATRHLAARSPLGVCVVVDVGITVDCGDTGGLPPETGGDEGTRIPHHEHRLQEELVHPHVGHAGFDCVTDPFTNAGFLTLSDRGGQRHQCLGALVKHVAWFSHPLPP